MSQQQEPTLTPTDEQAAIIAATSESSDSMMIQAYAGAAKTTTLTMLSKKVRVPGLALAFNASIRDEMKKRMPGNFEVKTMNGLGYGALMRALPHISNFKVDDRKLGKLVTEVSRAAGMQLASDQWDALRALTSRAMMRGLVPNGEGQSPLLTDSPEAWALLAEEQGLDPDDAERMSDLAREVLLRSNQLVREGIVSFDDQVYYSTCVAGKFPKFPVLLVDEAQDLSLLNHKMLEMAVRPEGRLVVVGDAKQAIYAFRGADSDSLGKLSALRAQWISLPLATTFRCPKVVVGRQQGHAPGFRAFHTNPEGRFLRMASGYGPDDDVGPDTDGWTWHDLEAALPRPEASLAILCRNNAPLLAMAFKLLRRRIPIEFLGRDIGSGLVTLSRKIFPRDDMGPGEMLGALADWIASERSLLIANGQEEKVEGVEDRAEALRAVLSFAEVRDPPGLRRELGALFSSKAGARVSLASIHKAKGLEWDAVLHLDPWRVPSKWAKEAARRGDDAALRQEWNLRYVCETRTRHTLIEANVEDFQ